MRYRIVAMNGPILWRIVCRALTVLKSISVLMSLNTHYGFVDGDEGLNCSPFLACPVVRKEYTSAVFTKVRCDALRNQCIIQAFSIANKRQSNGGATFKAIFDSSSVKIPLEVHDANDGTYHIYSGVKVNMDLSVLKRIEGRIKIYLVTAVVDYDDSSKAKKSPAESTTVENFKMFPCAHSLVHESDYIHLYDLQLPSKMGAEVRKNPGYWIDMWNLHTFIPTHETAHSSYGSQNRLYDAFYLLLKEKHWRWVYTDHSYNYHWKEHNDSKKLRQRERRQNVLIIGDSVTLALCKDTIALLKMARAFSNINVICSPMYNIMCLMLDGRKKWSREQVKKMGCAPYPAASMYTVKYLQSCGQRARLASRGEKKSKGRGNLKCQHGTFTHIIIGTGRHEMLTLSALQYFMKLRVILHDVKLNYPQSEVMMIDVSAPRSSFDKHVDLSLSSDVCMLKDHAVNCSSSSAECRRFHQRYDIIDMYNKMIRLVCKELKLWYFSAYQMTEMVPSEWYDDHLHYDKKTGLNLNVAFNLLLKVSSYKRNLQLYEQ